MQYWQQNSNSVLENTTAAMKVMSFFSIMAIKAFYIIRPYVSYAVLDQTTVFLHDPQKNKNWITCTKL